MSIHERLAALTAELHVTGFASEMTTAWHRLSTLVAEELHALGGAAPQDLGTKLEELVKAEIAKLQPTLDGIAESLNKRTLERVEQLAVGLQTQLDERVKTLFEQLLAKAAAAETPKPADTPPAPVASVEPVAPVAAAPADAAPEAAAAV